MNLFEGRCRRGGRGDPPLEGGRRVADAVAVSVVVVVVRHRLPFEPVDDRCEEAVRQPGRGPEAVVHGVRQILLEAGEEEPADRSGHEGGHGFFRSVVVVVRFFAVLPVGVTMARIESVDARVLCAARFRKKTSFWWRLFTFSRRREQSLTTPTPLLRIIPMIGVRKSTRIKCSKTKK